MGNPLPLLDVEDHAGVVVEHGVVVVEGTDVLGDRIEGAPEGGPRLPVDRMGVGGSDHVGTGRMDLRVDGEGGAVDRPVSVHHLAAVSYTHLDVYKRQAMAKAVA